MRSPAQRIGATALSAALWWMAASAPAFAQLFDVDPGAIDYGAVRVGERAVETIRVTNTGNQTLFIQAVTPGGSNAFSFQQPGSFPIGPGLVWMLQVAFQPPAAQAFNGSVRIQFQNGPLVVVALAGVAFQNQPRIRITPSLLDFGGVQIGDESTRSIQISNQGNEVLQVRGIASSSTAFLSGETGGFALNSGGSRTVGVTFRPPTVGGFAATLQVDSDDPANPSLPVNLLGVGELPPIDFVATFVPDQLRVSPGATVPVAIRFQNLGEELLELRSIHASVLMPDGSTFSLGGLRITPARVPAGATVEVPGAVVLPEAFHQALSGGANEVQFVHTFTGSANGVTIEREARATLIPVGALGGEFTVHTVSIDFPFPATSVAEGSTLRARAHLFGRGTGSVMGRWLVDGFPFESLSVDLDGRQGVAQTLGPLPTAIVGRHRVALEIFEPVALVTPAVDYRVTPRETEAMRWVEAPGFGVYLSQGKLPRFAWTPRAGAVYHIEIDGTQTARRRHASWRPTPTTWEKLGGGGQRVVGVRAVIGDAESPLFEERIERDLLVLDEPVALTTECDAEGCSWSRAPGQSLYAVEWRDSVGEIVYRRITAATRLVGSRLAPLLATGSLRWSVEALNDHGEVVGRSAVSPWPRSWR